MSLLQEGESEKKELLTPREISEKRYWETWQEYLKTDYIDYTDDLHVIAANENLFYYYLDHEYRNIKIGARTLLNAFARAGQRFVSERFYRFLPSQLECDTNICGEVIYNICRNIPEQQPAPVIRKEIDEFLKNLYADVGEPQKYIYKSKKIQYMDLPIITLLFSYQHGRVYGESNKDYAEFRSRRKITVGMDSYLYTFKKTSDFFLKKFTSFNDRLFRQAQLREIDKVFKFFKIGRLLEQQKRIIKTQQQLKKRDCIIFWVVTMLKILRK